MTAPGEQGPSPELTFDSIIQRLDILLPAEYEQSWLFQGTLDISDEAITITDHRQLTRRVDVDDRRALFGELPGNWGERLAKLGHWPALTPFPVLEITDTRYSANYRVERPMPDPNVTYIYKPELLRGLLHDPAGATETYALKPPTRKLARQTPIRFLKIAFNLGVDIDLYGLTTRNGIDFKILAVPGEDAGMVVMPQKGTNPHNPGYSADQARRAMDVLTLQQPGPPLPRLMYRDPSNLLILQFCLDYAMAPND